MSTRPSGNNEHFDTICAMHVHVLALDGVFDLGLSAVLDAFHTANELAEISGFSGEFEGLAEFGVADSLA